MACKTCKKKPANNITNLQSLDYDRLKTAYDYVSIASKMTDEKWDYVEEVLQEIYPSRDPLNKSCSDCLRQAAKLIEYEYKKNSK